MFGIAFIIILKPGILKHFIAQVLGTN
jgi:hypothetical protein